jgi:tetratricopeptide (TPR) repeat protein
VRFDDRLLAGARDRIGRSFRLLITRSLAKTLVNLLLPIVSVGLPAWAGNPVKSYEGSVTIPTYRHSGRETEPPLFPTSGVSGMYPFTTYLMPYAGPAQPKRYAAVFLENEYLKITYIPEFGGRFFSVFDKLRGREMFYRNDVVKPASYNPRNSWPQSGMELTGPHDLHTLTLYGEPFWAHIVKTNADGSVSLILGETDPVYGMRVNFSATLHPGVAAIQISISCYNARDGRQPQMFWVNSAINATPKTRFIYPMSRTVGHTTAEVADWPLYNGTDYSWDRNNTHMLGVFGIDIYDDFQGAYQFDRDYGIFRYADRRIVQGMKLWTFGYGPGSKTYEEGYTDKAGPYVELQSGRHVWDGHYEWVAPHKVEHWTEWWIPVSKTDGLTTLTRDLALNLDIKSTKQAGKQEVTLRLYPTRVIPKAKLTVTSAAGTLLQESIDLSPEATWKNDLFTEADIAGLTVSVRDAAGTTLLAYRRPDENPGRKQYTPFTKPLEAGHPKLEEMGAEELTLAGEYRLKELDEPGATHFFAAALKKDEGFSRAHLLLGMDHFKAGRYEAAIQELTKAIQRDAYSDEAYYYLALSQFAANHEEDAERNLYYIWPGSAFYGTREYQLGRLSLARNDLSSAAMHFETAIEANDTDLLAHAGLTLVERKRNNRTEAARHLGRIEKLDPTSPFSAAERYLLSPSDPQSEQALLAYTGAQTQEALSLVTFYFDLKQWADAARLLQCVGHNNHDPFGTSSTFYYTLAYAQRRAGDLNGAAHSLETARKSRNSVDRFPYREESEQPLAEAVALNQSDATARWELGCWLYFHDEHKQAIEQWEQAIGIDPADFSSRRALGLAYAAGAGSIDKAAAELKRALDLRPSHLPTLEDLSAVYARAGRFDDQLAVLSQAYAHDSSNDELAEGVFAAELNKGRYDLAEQLLQTHRFAPRHRTYTLRDKFRIARYGEGSQAFNRHDYGQALTLFQSALKPPVSLGTDDFESQTSSRIEYSVGRSLEALGRRSDARQAYERAIAGKDQFSGDRDSWNSENFFVVLALDRLGQADEAKKFEQHFANFAETERDSDVARHRAEARLLLGLIAKRRQQAPEANQLLTGALEAEPDLLPARLELHGDVVDPLPNVHP